MLPLRFRRAYGMAASTLLCVLATQLIHAQQPTPPLGGGYSGLGERRQQLVDDWLSRFVKVTGQSLEARLFYDDILSVSTKTTFDAVTHALMATPLTDASGQKFGDGLALIERVDTVKGEVSGASGDRQFRMYVRLTPDAREMLDRSREFKRGIDNTVYHKGYPINYREQRGTPSIQVSIALDGRQADVDVDYRSSSFPAMLLNGHLSAANSDVRAGNNADRHAAQWTGLQKWWSSFFGVRLERAPETLETTSALVLPTIPRAGKKDVKVMAPDFLQAWLVEGDVVAAMGYVSERSYACLAQDTPDPYAFDRGVAPFQILLNLKAAREALGKPGSLEGLTIGAPLTIPGLRAISHPHQAQFLLYEVPDDLAARFDCETRLIPRAARGSRAYGQHFATTFRIAGPATNASIALLWAKAGRILEDRVLADRAGARCDAGSACAARAHGRADQGRSPPRSRRERLRGHLVDTQGLRCGVSIHLDEKLRVLRPRAGSGSTGVDIPRRCRPEDSRRSRTRRQMDRLAQSRGDHRGCRAAPPVDTRDESAVLAQSSASRPSPTPWPTPSNVTRVPVARCRRIPYRSNTETPSA